jgi:hypothetical protein
MVGLWLVVVAGLVAAGAYMAVTAFVVLPEDYRQLRAHGVHATGLLEGCHGPTTPTLLLYTLPIRLRCDVVYTFAGVRHEHGYPHTIHFDGNATHVQLLVDPKHPGTAFMVADVKTNRGAGWDTQGYIALALLAAGALVFFGARAIQ